MYGCIVILSIIILLFLNFYPVLFPFRNRTVKKIDKDYKNYSLAMPKIFYTDKKTNIKYIAFFYDETESKLYLDLYKISEKNKLELICEGHLLIKPFYKDNDSIIKTLKETITHYKIEIEKSYHTKIIKLP